MILGYNPTLKQATLEQELEFCEKHGFQGIELRIEKLRDYLERHTLEELEIFFTHSNLKALSLNALENVLFADEETKRKNRDDLDLLCRVGSLLGIRDLVVVPSFHNTQYTLEEIRKESIEVLSQMLEITEKYDLRIAYEFVGNPKACVNTFEQCYEIVSALDSKRVGISLDFFHFYAMNSSLDDLKKADVEKIFLVHINDADFYPPGALREEKDRLFPGEGAIPIQEYMDILKQLGYNGTVSVELFRDEYNSWDIEEFVRNARETTERFIYEKEYIR